MIQTISTPLGQIQYSEVGSGNPVLILHGGHSNAEEDLFQRNLYGEGFRVITPSRPGYGDTPLSDFAQPEAAAELIISLMDSLEIKEFSVLGISADGLTAIQLAAEYLERVSKLLLMSAVTRK